jgi:hypothetical protein
MALKAVQSASHTTAVFIHIWCDLGCNLDSQFTHIWLGFTAWWRLRHGYDGA